MTFSQVYQALRSAWFPIARLEDLEQGPKGTVLLDVPLVAFLSGEDYAVLSRRCLHRGGDLALGVVNAEGLACPYHGWRYGTDGVCNYIPAAGSDAPIPSAATLSSYPTHERFGLLWTCVGRPLIDPPNLPELEEHKMRFLAAEPVETRAGILNSIENFRDVAHLPFVHRESMGDVPHKVNHLEVRKDGYETWLTRRLNASDGDTGLYQGLDDMEVTYHASMPSLASARLNYGEQGERIVMECFQPLGLSGGCRIFLVSGTGATYTAGTPQEALAAEVTVLSEDRPILDSLDPSEVPLDGTAVQLSTVADRYTSTTRQAFVDFIEAALT